MKRTCLLLAVLSALSIELILHERAAAAPSPVATVTADELETIRRRYTDYLLGSETFRFESPLAKERYEWLLGRFQGTHESVAKFDFRKDTDRKLAAWGMYVPDTALVERIFAHMLFLSTSYHLRGPSDRPNPYYHNPETLGYFLRCVEYLQQRGFREDMVTAFQQKPPADPPPVGCFGGVFLRMSPYCRSMFLMRRQLHQRGVLDKYLPAFRRIADPARWEQMTFEEPLGLEGGRVYLADTLNYALTTDNLEEAGKILAKTQEALNTVAPSPAWEASIKRDGLGWHHAGPYGTFYTSGALCEFSLGVSLLHGTRFGVKPSAVDLVRQALLTGRLYSQKYCCPHGLRGRGAGSSAFVLVELPAILALANPDGLDDDQMKRAFLRLWAGLPTAASAADGDEQWSGLLKRRLNWGERGQHIAPLSVLELAEQMVHCGLTPEPDPAGTWVKPYGALLLHRRDDWMVAVKGYSKYVWGFETMRKQNELGQFLSCGGVEIFCGGKPVGSVQSGFNLDKGWDWYRWPGVTAPHFLVADVEKAGLGGGRAGNHRTFVGGVSLEGRNGMFALEYEDLYTKPPMTANKSVFCVDDLLVLVGSDIQSKDTLRGRTVETTLFQNYLPSEHSETRINGKPLAGIGLEKRIDDGSPVTLADVLGNGYFVPSAKGLNVTRKSQTHFTESRTTKAHGDFATAWIDHGREPRGAGYEYVILVRGKDKIEELARAPGKYYRVIQKGAGLHMVASTAGGITGYAFFDPAARPKEGLLKSVDRQCLVMTRGVCQQLRISVCNPDFAWVPQKVAGGFTGAMAQRGKHRESKVVPVQVCLQGCWQVAQPRRTIDVRIVSANDKNTVLAVDCYDAMPIEATLVKAGSAAGLAPQSDHAPDEVRKPDLEKQSELIAVLQSKEATPAQKRTACAGLVNAGTERCVPVLAELLADETMAPSARLVLRNLPYPQADAAFRQALAALSGQGRLAVVESIAVRRDRQAVAPLAELLGSGDPLLVHAALAALGRVGGPESASALTRFQPAAINIRIVWADACLLCADQLYSEGQGAAGSKLYRQVALDNDVPRYVRWEALRRIALTEKSAALPLLMQLATDLDAKTQEESLRIAHVFLPGARATEAIAGRLRWLPPTGQIAILGLLGERGDPAAAPYITTLVSAKGTDKAVRAAASAALAALTH